MGYDEIETLQDLSRHRLNLAVTCRCGNKSVLDGRRLHSRFMRANWMSTLRMARQRLRCTKCAHRYPEVEPTDAEVTRPAVIVRGGRATCASKQYGDV